MTAVPLLSGGDVAQALMRLGWQTARQHDSHVILVKPGHPATLPVPDPREVTRGTPQAILRRASVTLEDFLAATS